MADPRNQPPGTNPPPGANPIPDTAAPRQPAQAPTPVPQPQPGTQDSTRPGLNQRDASEAAALEEISAEQRAGLVQNSGGGADNAVEAEDGDEA